MERGFGSSQYVIREEPESEPEPEPFHHHQQLRQVDDSRYQSAKWWRNLNRFMSVLGLFILGAIAALVVVGVRQGWGQ